MKFSNTADFSETEEADECADREETTVEADAERTDGKTCDNDPAETKLETRWLAAGAIVAAIAAGLLFWQQLRIEGAFAALLAVLLAALVPLRRWKRLPSLVARLAVTETSRESRIANVVVVALVILATTLPMGLSPMWNDDFPTHHDQYKMLAESFLQGRIDLDLEVDPLLQEMQNPYDPSERQSLGVDYHPDHAYYDGHYYMYFGVVPTVLVFLPFRAITGTSLLTYHATQLFAGLFVVAFYLLLRLMARRFFPHMKLFDFLLMFAALSFMCLWYPASAPALYCTAITAGASMMAFGVYFFCRAVWVPAPENRQIALAALGALFGALAIGCRPPAAVANLLVVPLLVVFLRDHAVTPKLVGKLVLAALPYVVVIALLGAYNYARFGNVLEFGQTYQLTVIDQHTYGNFLQRLAECNYPVQLRDFFAGNTSYVAYPGIFGEFPLLLSMFLLLGKRARRYLAKQRLHGFAVGVVVVVLVMTLAMCATSPWLVERYKADLLWLLGLLAFMALGCVGESWEAVARGRILTVARILCVHAMFASMLLFLRPSDSNFTDYYRSEIKAFLLGQR